MSMHQCKAEGCNQTIGTQLLMCLKHWRMVDARTQYLIYRTWREYRHNKAGAFEQYCSLVKSAVAQVAKHEGVTA